MQLRRAGCCVRAELVERALHGVGETRRERVARAEIRVGTQSVEEAGRERRVHHPLDHLLFA